MRAAAQLLLLGAAVAAALFARSAAEERRQPLPVSVSRVMSLPPEWTRVAALGFDSLASDLFWIRFIQRMPLRPAGPELGASLAADLRSVIDLDPEFRSAYLHGSVLLSVLGDEPCAALDVAARGATRFPDDWRLPFQAGYTCFVELSDDVCGARHMQRASTLPGAPRWLPALVARLLSGAGDSDAAIAYLRHQLTTTTDPILKARFEERLNDAVLTRDLQTIDEARRKFVSERASEPGSVEELVGAGLLEKIPPEPFGGRYLLLPSGHAGSTSGRGRLQAARVQAHHKAIAFDVRLEGRVHKALPDVFSPRLERLSAKAGRAEAILVPLVMLQEREEDPARLETLRVLQARILVHADVRDLRSAQLDLMRKGAPPTLGEIVAASGVRKLDPFGLPYMLDEGVPTSHGSSNPITFVADATGRRIQESPRCQ